MIVQEDRNLVMAGAGILDLDRGHGLDAAYLAIAEHRPLPLGRYLLLRSRGDEAYWTYQAVVHDLECKPTCRAGNVRRSLTAILKDGVKGIKKKSIAAWDAREAAAGNVVSKGRARTDLDDDD